MQTKSLLTRLKIRLFSSIFPTKNDKHHSMKHIFSLKYRTVQFPHLNQNPRSPHTAKTKQLPKPRRDYIPDGGPPQRTAKTRAPEGLPRDFGIAVREWISPRIKHGAPGVADETALRESLRMSAGTRGTSPGKPLRGARAKQLESNTAPGESRPRTIDCLGVHAGEARIGRAPPPSIPLISGGPLGSSANGFSAP